MSQEFDPKLPTVTTFYDAVILLQSMAPKPSGFPADLLRDTCHFPG